jgi:hypothetical protein
MSKEGKDADLIRREEARGLFVLGLMAAFLSLRDRVGSEPPLDIMGNQVKIIDLLDVFLWLWGLYSFLMIIVLTSERPSQSRLRPLIDYFVLGPLLVIALMVAGAIVFSPYTMPFFPSLRIADVTTALLTALGLLYYVESIAVITIRWAPFIYSRLKVRWSELRRKGLRIYLNDQSRNLQEKVKRFVKKRIGGGQHEGVRESH